MEDQPESPVGEEKGTQMRVELRTLKDNPKRDFIVDPIDQDMVKRLTASIKEDGFWGGVVCRKHNGHIEIAAGHHRVRAAMKAGIEFADLFVGRDIDDTAMIRIYARENATQRSAAGTSLAGSVAAAFRELVKQTALQSAGSATRGLQMVEFGNEAIASFIKMSPEVVQEQATTLKASGDYSRIAREVAEEIEHDYPDNEEAIDRAKEIASHLTAKHSQVFDFVGVAKHLNVPTHVNAFRKMVTGDGIAPFLDVKQQARVAKRVVDLAKETGAELSERFIRENVYNLAREVKEEQRKITDAEIREMERRNWQSRWENLESDFVSATSQMLRAAKSLTEHEERRPKGRAAAISFNFQQALKDAEKAVALLRKVAT